MVFFTLTRCGDVLSTLIEIIIHNTAVHSCCFYLNRQNTYVPVAFVTSDGRLVEAGGVVVGSVNELWVSLKAPGGGSEVK